MSYKCNFNAAELHFECSFQRYPTCLFFSCHLATCHLATWPPGHLATCHLATWNAKTKLWPKIVFWEIAHCILHCKVGVCVTTLKTQKNKKLNKKSCKLGNYYTKYCGLNVEFKNCIFKDNPSEYIWFNLNWDGLVFLKILPVSHNHNSAPPRSQLSLRPAPPYVGSALLLLLTGQSF